MSQLSNHYCHILIDSMVIFEVIADICPKYTDIGKGPTIHTIVPIYCIFFVVLSNFPFLLNNVVLKVMKIYKFLNHFLGAKRDTTGKYIQRALDSSAA